MGAWLFREATEYEGRIVLGCYRLEALIGRGSHGLVFRGSAVESGRSVAVKIPLFLDEPRYARFEREARALAQVNHRNVSRFIDFGFFDGLPVIVTEYFEGRGLDRLMLDAHGPIRWERAVEIITPVLDALDALHDSAVIHRDVKPSNILVASSGPSLDVRLIDLGICYEEQLDDQTNITEDSQVLGTLNYMAPEQLLNLPVDHRCDIYAAGCVLFEMLCDRLPFLGGAIQQAMAKCASDGPSSLIFRGDCEETPFVPAGVTDVLLPMLRRAPDERPNRARDCARAFQWMFEEATHAQPST